MCLFFFCFDLFFVVVVVVFFFFGFGFVSLFSFFGGLILTVNCEN